MQKLGLDQQLWTQKRSACYHCRSQIHEQGVVMDGTTIIRIVAGLLFVVVLVIAILPPYWMIFKKAGFSPWLALLMYIPLANIIVLYVVAFSDWKTAIAPRPVSPPFPPQA
jgi:hypothetical protein